MPMCVCVYQSDARERERERERERDVELPGQCIQVNQSNDQIVPSLRYVNRRHPQILCSPPT